MHDHTAINVERFNSIARSWDEGPVRTQLARAVASAIHDALPLSGRERALEPGCGTGLVTALLAPSLGSVVAADSSAGMLAVLREKAPALGLDNVEPVEIDLAKEMPPGPFDLVFSSMTLHHIEDVPGLLRRFADVLAPGGHVALADLEREDGSFHGDMEGIAHHGFDTEAFSRDLEAAGFVGIEIRRAHVVDKEAGDGCRRHYPVFLATARKPARLP